MKQNNLNQSGRSMVEMLGTLAIIGVLSIGGIAGYSYGMDKYRANRTMNDVRLRAMDVLAQFNATGDASLDNWKNEKTIYPITLEDETIGIQVDKVPERVCEMMAEGMEHSSSAIKINAKYVEEDTSDCGDDNTLVFYFDDVLPDDEENVNEPIREQCGDVLCEQCFTCDQDTMTCVSVMEKMDNISTLDDLRICSSNGYKSYCGVSELYGSADMGCINLGSCSGDPECNALIDGRCEALDSTMYLQVGIGGFRCTKNGKDGYCMNGQCSEGIEISDSVKACIGKENEATCEVNGQTGMCMLGQCLLACSEQGIKCDAAGEDGFCLAELCVPLTNDGCNIDMPILSSILGPNMPVDDGFTCDIDGKEGVCSNGVCTTSCTSDSDCTNENLPYCVDGMCATCTQDSHCTHETAPICSNGKCVLCAQDSHCDPVSGYCMANTCYMCPSDTPYRVNGSCVECLDNSDCTDRSFPHCIKNTCSQCISHDECNANQYCGDTNQSDSEANLGGSCYDLDYDSYTLTYTDTSGVSKTETFYVLDKEISWWDAKSVCERLGKKLGKSLNMLSSNELVTDKIENKWLGTRERTDLTKKFYEKTDRWYHVWTSDLYIIGIGDGEVSSRLPSFSGNILVNSGAALCR